MYPTLKDGDVVLVERCETDHLKIGDIVYFTSGIKHIAHRIIRIFQQDGVTFFQAQGDKNTHPDKPFQQDDFRGRIIARKRGNQFSPLTGFRSRIQSFTILHFRRCILPCNNARVRLCTLHQNIPMHFSHFVRNMRMISVKAKKPFLHNAIISVLQGLAPFLLIICIKSLVDVLSKTPGSGQTFWSTPEFLLPATAAVFLLSGLLTSINGYFFEKLSFAITSHTFQLLHQKHAALDLAHYEDPTQQDKIHRAIQEASFRPVKITNDLLTLLRSLASVSIMIVLFLDIKWYLVLLLLAAIIPGIFVRLRYARKRYHLKETQSAKERERAYFNRILTGFAFAREMRLFRFSDLFLKRFRHDERQLHTEKQTIQKSEMWADIAAQIYSVLLIFASLFIVVWLMGKGLLTIGAVVMFFFVFQRGYSVLGESFRSLTSLVEDSIFLNDLADFLELPVGDKTSGETKPEPLQKGLRVENLSFRYENSTRDALKNIHLDIPAGKTVALIGANGSGKTTLVKLLCGFYTPQEGRILYDDIPFQDLEMEAFRKQISAIFQDFAIYNLSARENIGLGDISKPFDLEKAKKAAREAGIDEALERLPQGYETMLGNLFKGGEELSIGQWQKIAIARALYRDSPILFMDEPSSALDVNSEKQMLDSLQTMAKNKTVILISHRLSTVQWADLIYVLDKGEVIESGNHESLMQKEGTYFQMYRTGKDY